MGNKFEKICCHLWNKNENESPSFCNKSICTCNCVIVTSESSIEKFEIKPNNSNCPDQIDGDVIKKCDCCHPCYISLCKNCIVSCKKKINTHSTIEMILYSFS